MDTLGIGELHILEMNLQVLFTPCNELRLRDQHFRHKLHGRVDLGHNSSVYLGHERKQIQ